MSAGALIWAIFTHLCAAWVGVLCTIGAIALCRAAEDPLPPQDRSSKPERPVDAS